MHQFLYPKRFEVQEIAVNSHLRTSAVGTAPTTQSGARVRMQQKVDGQWEIQRDGVPYQILGAGGCEHLEWLREAGGNTLRTWGIEQLETTAKGESLLDKAHRLDLMVVVGIWLTPPRRGADYAAEEFLQQQRNRVKAAVQKYRDHPAVLMWGLGNEMEEDGDDPNIWRELELLAQMIKQEDPHHLICTVIAGTAHHKVAHLMEYYSSLDILGVNVYGGAETVDTELAAQGWDRPYLLTEFGATGHWEVPTTPWGAPVEPSAASKVTSYETAHTAQFSQGRGLCLGTFCFLWGHKQETTATWFGMFLPSGEKTPTVDVMSRLWTGREPENPAPMLHDIQAAFREQTVARGSEHEVWAEVSGRGRNSLIFEWQVVAETHDRRSGGDPEETPPIIPDCVVENLGNRARIRVPDTKGAYRIFLYVRDGQGGGVGGNFPFYVE